MLKNLKKKLQEINFNIFFNDFSGGNNFDTVIEFLKKQFFTLVQSEGNGNRDVFSQNIDALDSQIVATVFNTISNHFLNQIQKNHSNS